MVLVKQSLGMCRFIPGDLGCDVGANFPMRGKSKLDERPWRKFIT